MSRRTFQPRDIVVENVRLEYTSLRNIAGTSNNSSELQQRHQLPSQVLLEDTTLKLLSGHVYGLLGRNGVGKTTLLRRIQSGKIPGFPPHIATLYIPQELTLPSSLPTTTTTTFSTDHTTENENDEQPQEATNASAATTTSTVLEVVQQEFLRFSKKTSTSLHYQMELIEQELDNLDETQEEEKIEDLCQELSNLQEALEEMEESTNNNDNQNKNNNSWFEEAQRALDFFGLGDHLWQLPYNQLSPGQRKKVALAVAVLCSATVSSSQQLLLCLDEPQNHLDVQGLIKLRQFLQAQTNTSNNNEDDSSNNNQNNNRTVLLVSHDTDLLNDVTTDIIVFSHVQKNLLYYPGNYNDYQRQYAQHELHLLRQQVSLDKKRHAMVQTIHHLQEQPAPKRGGNKKKAKMIAAQRRKLERTGLETNDKGHRWSQQRAGTGIKPGAINGIDASTRKDLSTAELLQLAEASIRPPPDKAVQFFFRNTTCTWGEPLIMALDVGHGYGVTAATADALIDKKTLNKANTITITKKPGFLFDCVDICIKEGHTYCLLGATAAGKSTLLRILAKQEEPLEGSVHHATNVQVGYFGQETMDKLLEECWTSGDKACGAMTALSYLAARFPTKTEQELRGELTNFGLSPTQATTNVSFLSGGERTRLCLAVLMLENPQVLCLDNPSTNLDVESVEALIYGLRQWNGTVVMVSHDINLIRSLDTECAVLVEEEGKLRRVDGSVDNYLRTFQE